ncbi:transcription elongation factor SPT5 [Fistulifera solaris]|uniref:Transcription elongation factor SPT5 n=1 Tax=Fistulifera solaris TaxID=1519565 RepID=A0A1Z5JME4_FISSO|nr:transcription elongation factor SPT5 [Fistulifera solaris]|eukprot:GAX15032.1 transcription elongation factor SPT5 [Fistulifera solaris]
MSKKFFRPTAENFEDSDDDDDESDQDEALGEDAAPKRSVNANLSDDDEDDEDEDDDDEDDDEEEDKNQKKRKASSGGARDKKRSKAMSFFELEAEASDDDDDDDDGYRGKNKDDENMDAEAQEIIRQQDRRRAQAGRFGERSVADIARDLEERHRMQNRTVHRSRIVDHPVSAVPAKGGSRPTAMPRVSQTTAADLAEEAPEMYTNAVAQQSLVPSVKDPSFWMVSCANGKEQELVMQLMNKCVAMARQGNPLGITGAIAAQSKGKIYVESFSEPAVMEAIQGVRGLLQYTMRLVPIQDMTTVMTVVSKKKPVKKNEWVRMTRGHYKGDLALVKDVKESGLKCIIQCIPRLDLTLADLPPEEARIRRKTIRPPKRFFNPQELASLGRQSLRRQRFPGLDVYCDYFEGNFYQDGYLLKEMTVGSMVKPCSEEDPPTLEELQSFQRRKSKKDSEYDDYDDGEEENEGSKVAASLLDELSDLQGKTGLGSKTSDGGLMIGDTVEVIEGDLIGMRGKLISLDGSTVKIKPHAANIDLGGMDEVEFLIGQVRKYIPVGAHVKVTDGRYANETGVVVAVEKLDGESDFTAVVLTDVTNKEVSVRTSQLRESAEIASGQDRLSGYELYDLVVLSGGGSANEVGVIVRVGREDFTVINNHGLAREVRPEELRGKRNSTSVRAVALDVQGNQIRCGDTVNVAEGPHKGKSATIKRMSRAQLFLHSQTRSEHAGIFVVRSRSCVLSGSRQQSRGPGMDGGVSPFATPQSQTTRGPVGGRGNKDDGLIGKTVRVQAGQWKGYIGTVTDTTATHVQVELHSRLKKVLVVREKVIVVGDKFGATSAESQAIDSMESNHISQAMATPMHTVGGATPAHGFGGATPSHDSGVSDEVWRPGGAVDQEAIKDDGWGSSAAYGGVSDSYHDNGTVYSDIPRDDGWGAPANTGWGSAPSTAPTRDSQSASSRAPVKHEQADDMEETPVWFMERVWIKLKGSDAVAVIKDINPDKSALVELEDKSTRTIRSSEAMMVPPVEHDTVLVTGGNEIGLEGSLVCVDGTDAILKIMNDEFKIIDFVHLVKISADN